MTITHNIAARVSVLTLAVAAGAGLALGVGPVGGDEQSGQLARSCEREKYMVAYWDTKANISAMFLVDPAQVARMHNVASRHLEFASEACTSG